MVKFLCVFVISFFMCALPVWAKDSDVYRVNCLPEVGVMEIKRYATGGFKSAFFEDVATMHEKGYRHPMWKHGRPDMYQHQCIIHGQQLAVKIDVLKYTKEKHGAQCHWYKQSTLRINAWLEGNKIIDNLRFEPGCTIDRNYLGPSISTISIAPQTEETKWNKYVADVIFDIHLEDVVRSFGIKYSPPFKDNTRLSKGQPITNADVHGEDIDKFFPPDLQAP